MEHSNSFLYRIFIDHFNMVGVGYNSLKNELENYIAKQQTRIFISSLCLLVSNFYWLTTGPVKILFTLINISCLVMFIHTIVCVIIDYKYFVSKKRRQLYKISLVDEDIIKLCVKLDKLPQTYYSGLQFSLRGPERPKKYYI